VKVIKRFAPLVAAFVLLCLATVLALLAVDVHAWQHQLARDDLRFQADPSHAALWRSPATLPGDPADMILGLGDALSYRQAMRNFWFNEIGVVKVKGVTDLSAARIETQTQLQQLSTGAATAAERSVAANLLGVMAITTTATNKATLAQILSSATSDFQLAVAENPASWAAKVNLELVLRLKRPGKSRFGTDAHGGFGFGGSEGASPKGGGF
jgi:hypothetical protein